MTKLGPDDYRKLYYYLRLTRSLEDWIHYICANQNPQKPLIIGKGYLSTGQEAVSVGAAFGMESGDWLAQSHRDFGALLVRGFTVHELLRQYFSKADSPTKGRDANVHLGDTSKKVLGFISHMGIMLSVANGVAWAAQSRGDKAVALAFFGDGASSQGVVHEAINYAAVFKLPVVFICNNNRWAISTPLEEQFVIENLADRALGYGIPGYVCDGNNVVDVYSTVKPMIDRARRGEGPSLIECKTMRMAGHGTHDRTKFNSDAEQEAWKKKDPLITMENFLIKEGMANAAYFEKLAEETNALVRQATEMVQAEPGPDPSIQQDAVFASSGSARFMRA